MAWLIKQDKSVDEAMYTAWPPTDDWSELTFDDKLTLYSDFYLDDYEQFYNDKRIGFENDEFIAAYFDVVSNASETRLIETALTGNRFHIPDIKTIPWPVRELLKISKMVDDLNSLEDSIQTLPTNAKEEQIAKHSKKQDKAYKDWHNIIQYANNLDLFNIRCKQYQNKRGV